MEALSSLGLVFLIWQMAAIFKMKNLSINAMIKISDLPLYKINMWLSILAYIGLIVFKLSLQSQSLTTNTAILSFVAFVQIALCFYIFKYKSVLYDLKILSDLRLQGNIIQAERMFRRLYYKIYNILFMMLSSYLRHNSYIVRSNNRNTLHYELSSITYLVDAIEKMVNDFDLRVQLTITEDRRKLENKILQDKL